VWPNAEPAEEEPAETPDLLRKREFNLFDPTWTVNTENYVMETFRGTISAAGGEEAFQQQWLAGVDKNIVDSFQLLMSGPRGAIPRRENPSQEKPPWEY
jgi:hypothetical protein